MQIHFFLPKMSKPKNRIFQNLLIEVNFKAGFFMKNYELLTEYIPAL